MYIPIGRAGNRVINQIGKGGGLKPPPSHPGRGMLAFARVRGRGTETCPSPSEVRNRNFTQVIWGEEFIELDSLLIQELPNPQEGRPGP